MVRIPKAPREYLDQYDDPQRDESQDKRRICTSKHIWWLRTAEGHFGKPSLYNRIKPKPDAAMGQAVQRKPEEESATDGIGQEDEEEVKPDELNTSQYAFV